MQDWSLIRSFLAVADTGSLSGAAAQLRASQPTLGRHIRQLEANLGVTLFQRAPRGLTLTEDGTALLPAAEAMRAHAEQFALTAAGQDQQLQGTVRITASVVASQYVLPPILAQIRTAEPGISLELAPSDTSENLLYREADIAVRMYRPRQEAVITRHIGQLPMALFAHRNLIAAHGMPRTLEDVMRIGLVGFDQDRRMITEMEKLGMSVTRTDFPVRSDDQAAIVALIRAGCGIGAMFRMIGENDPDLCEVMPDIPVQPIDIWLTAAEAMQRVPRMRRVYSLLAEGLRPLTRA
ncbi:DNA-binding transcriptional LysR family regulator [Rubricella aquisinus]|uniref:DNA-binding transcriptional LysR family regulator n=1 Tax=Rubricella aquisinus TaxID=2028108 RepID=A0A840WX42_9RHOB|nr:LysR family transcriptional regulator [Rubricella aquisinus]MBB5514255.1 DNA-binding transcriptional LysR family regulator [Rubricella aquisinus]